MKKNLTPRQNEIFTFIKSFIGDHKYPPTFREVADNFDISVKGSYDHIKAIEKKGWIKCILSKFRALEVMDDESSSDDEPVKKVPLLGNVAAGKPLLAAENLDGTIDVPSQFLGSGIHFALNVKGDSMKDAGILEGDIAVIRQQNDAENGQIVVAMLDDSVTLKKLYKETNRVRLQSANPRFSPIYTTDVRIVGRLACVIRSYA
ncbi:MAG: transcriptional repressor LexA [Spirochaetales bacterium]|nr:transcriptional repressor LexA [Spirochaetales bacterium]